MPATKIQYLLLMRILIKTKILHTMYTYNKIIIYHCLIITKKAVLIID